MRTLAAPAFAKAMAAAAPMPWLEPVTRTVLPANSDDLLMDVHQDIALRLDNFHPALNWEWPMPRNIFVLSCAVATSVFVAGCAKAPPANVAATVNGRP